MIIGDYSDKGGASRFFYQAKVGKKERNMGLDAFEEKQTRMKNNDDSNTDYKNEKVAAKYQAIKAPAKNSHPTVKPINLMAYLCRLITPPNGIVLDPFMGSGSTGIAAKLEGFDFIGMELDEDYFKIASARVESYEKYRDLLKK
jgi:site-specific DNA-methyltransferase (adenine-specific)